MRRLYSERRRCLIETLRRLGVETAVPAGLSVVVPLPRGFDDQKVMADACGEGLKPAPLSPWFAAEARGRSGLMLGVANVLERRIEHDCRHLLAMIGDPPRHVGCGANPLAAAGLIEA
jgi:GntR family transcriptional regulator/MocR family aminotransferase